MKGMQEECAQFGWDRLSEMIGMSKRALFRRRPELENCGAIFYMRLGRRRQRTMCYFPSVIKAFFLLKGSKREIF